MLFIQIYKGESHVSASPLLITILISSLLCLSLLFTKIEFTCSHSQLHMQKQEHNSMVFFSICLSEKQIWCWASSFLQWSPMKTEASPWNHRLQSFFARMITKPGTASTEPSNAFCMAEAAGLRVHKCLRSREVSQQCLSVRVFFKWKNKHPEVAHEIYLKQDLHWSEFVYQLILIYGRLYEGRFKVSTEKNDIWPINNKQTNENLKKPYDEEKSVCNN